MTWSLEKFKLSSLQERSYQNCIELHLLHFFNSFLPFRFPWIRECWFQCNLTGIWRDVPWSPPQYLDTHRAEVAFQPWLLSISQLFIFYCTIFNVLENHSKLLFLPLFIGLVNRVALGKSIDLDGKDILGCTSCMNSCISGHKEVVKCLLDD